jgi:hypothetical protein
MITNKKIEKEDFLKFCHTLYDKLHGEKKVNEIFDIPEEQLNDINKLYSKNIFTRFVKINKYILKYTKIDDNRASSFYVNAFQHYITYSN